MPNIFLSPSTQEYNPVIIGGNEEIYTNRIADKLEDLLQNAGVNFGRNDRTKTVGQSIRDSNKGYYNLHLALHSNSSPPNLSGQQQGIDVYYNPQSKHGKGLATMFANNLKKIYPYPDKVRIMPTTSLVELNRTKAPAVLLELGYHDNYEDASWIAYNTDLIARNLFETIKEIYGIK